MKKVIALTTITVLLAALFCGVAWAGELTQTGTCFQYLWAKIGPRRVCVEQFAHCTDGSATFLTFNTNTGRHSESSNKCDRIAPGGASGATGIMTATCTTCGESKTLRKTTSW